MRNERSECDSSDIPCECSRRLLVVLTAKVVRLEDEVSRMIRRAMDAEAHVREVQQDHAVAFAKSEKYRLQLVELKERGVI